MISSKNSPKIVVRTKYQLSLNNPDNKYNSKDCKKVNQYIEKMLEYYSNIEKRAENLIDYYTGKINKHMDINLILENGKYATKNEMESRKKYISNKIKKSNLWQVVLSFDNSYIDSHISLDDLEQKMAKEIIPSFLKQMGFENINKMQYQLSLHTNTDNYHFHISFMEKAPNTRDSNNTLSYRRKGKIPMSCINFLKNQTILSIEREHEFKPKAIAINKDIDEIKEFFDIKSYNNILKDKKSFNIEEKILTLGKLIEEKNISNNSKIKYNSINDEEIKELTKSIKNDLFRTEEDLKDYYGIFKKSINNMNNYLTETAMNNHISKKNIDISYTKNKEKYLENYILNSIVNYSKLHYQTNKDKIKITTNDVIQSIIYQVYRKNKKFTKKNIISNYYKKNDFKLKREVKTAIKNINYEMKEATDEFHKLFLNEDEKVKSSFLE